MKTKTAVSNLNWFKNDCTLEDLIEHLISVRTELGDGAWLPQIDGDDIEFYLTKEEPMSKDELKAELQEQLVNQQQHLTSLEKQHNYLIEKYNHQREFLKNYDENLAKVRSGDKSWADLVNSLNKVDESEILQLETEIAWVKQCVVEIQNDIRGI